MTKNFIQDGDVIDYINATGAIIASGSVVVIGSEQCGIALVTIAIGGTGAVAKEGVFSLAKNTTQATTVGQKLWWDTTLKQVNTLPILGAYFVGFAAKAELAATATVSVLIDVFNNEGPRTLTLPAAGTTVTLANGDFGGGDLAVFVPNTVAVTLILPFTGNIPPGSKLFVRKTDAAAFAVTIDPASTEQIAGALTYATIATLNAYAQFINSGTAWLLMAAG